MLVANRRPAAGEETVRQITAAGGRAPFQRTDVTREEDCAAAVATATERFGRLDVLVNNAGIFPRATLEETTVELWEEILATNLRGPFFLCKHAVPALRRAGGGSIINLGSTNAYCGLPTLFAYSCAKGGLLTLTRNLARALTPDRIRVNLLNPGWVISEGEVEVQALEGHDAAWIAEMGPRQPLGRHQLPRDAALAAVFLAAGRVLAGHRGGAQLRRRALHARPRRRLPVRRLSSPPPPGPAEPAPPAQARRPRAPAQGGPERDGSRPASSSRAGRSRRSTSSLVLLQAQLALGVALLEAGQHLLPELGVAQLAGHVAPAQGDVRREAGRRLALGAQVAVGQQEGRPEGQPRASRGRAGGEQGQDGERRPHHDGRHPRRDQPQQLRAGRWLRRSPGPDGPQQQQGEER